MRGDQIPPVFQLLQDTFGKTVSFRERDIQEFLIQFFRAQPENDLIGMKGIYLRSRIQKLRVNLIVIRIADGKVQPVQFPEALNGSREKLRRAVSQDGNLFLRAFDLQPARFLQFAK